SISKDNITTLYGLPHRKPDGSVDTQHSRIAEPTDATRTFSWLICQSYDDKGNAILYEYAAENGDNVELGQANERNRERSANRYLKGIKYGNRKPNRDANWKATDPALLSQPDDWMFEVVFDYDQAHYTELPLDPSKPEAEQHRFVVAQAGAASSSPVRQDSF